MEGGVEDSGRRSGEIGLGVGLERASDSEVKRHSRRKHPRKGEKERDCHFEDDQEKYPGGCVLAKHENAGEGEEKGEQEKESIADLGCVTDIGKIHGAPAEKAERRVGETQHNEARGSSRRFSFHVIERMGWHRWAELGLKTRR